MKKFFKFGKEKNKTPEPSPTLSKHGSVSVLCGYEIREKDLSKLHKAAWNGDLNKVKQLAKKDASPLDKQNRTPLHLACVKGFASIVTELLEWKAKPNLCDNDGKTPLLKAVECKNEDCVKQLLEHKADPNVKDLAGESSLHYVVRDGSTNIMQVLLKSHNIIVDIKNKNGETPLHIAVKKRNLKMAELLLKHGADINAPNNNGETVLMEATVDGATDLVKFLLENGADVNRKNKSGWTADDLASMEHQDDIRVILSKYMGHETESLEEMAVSEVVGASADVIPPAPGMYGAPATNKEGDYSEIDVSKMSEATGGLDTWNDNTDDDDESEVQLPRKETSNISVDFKHNDEVTSEKEQMLENVGIDGSGHTHDQGAKHTIVTDGLSDKSSDPEELDNIPVIADEQVPGLNLAKNLNQSKESKRDTVSNDVMVSARSAISEPSLVDGDWSDSDSVLSSACETKKPVNKLRPNIQVIQEKDEKINADNVDIKDNASWDEESTVLSISANDKGHNNNTQLAEVSEEPPNTNGLDQKDGCFNGVPKSSSFSVNKETIKATLSMDSIEDVSDPEFDEVQGLNVAHNTKVEPSGDSDDSNWDSTELSPQEDIPASEDEANPSEHDDNVAPVDATVSQKSADEKLVRSKIEDEDVLMPHEEHQFQKKQWRAFDASHDLVLDGYRNTLTLEEELSRVGGVHLIKSCPPIDYQDDVESFGSDEADQVIALGADCQQGQNSPKSSLTKQEETPTADNAVVPAVDSPDEDSKWDSEESEPVEPPPLPTEAPPTSPPSASIHPEEDKDEFDADHVWRVQNDSPREQEQRHKEWQMETEQSQQQNEAVEEFKKKREGEDFPVKLNQQERVIEVTKDTTVKNTQRSMIERVVMEEGGASRLNEQRQAVDKEIAELASQRQVSRMRESLDEEDTFNDLSEMESTRKMNVCYQLPTGVSTVPDDDCLSYSSTEHENSIHDECRSHQLVPMSFSMSGDSTNVMRLQQQLRETQQKLEKERSARLSQENKRKSLDKDREDLIQKLEDVSKAKSQLEQQKIDMEATIRNLQYQLKEETEKCKNFEVLYNKTKEQLSRKDDQFTQEVESKQKSDLSLRNLQMELHTAQSLIKQLEEEKKDLEQQLIHEKNARILQEQLNEEQIKFQNSINKTGRRTEEGVCAMDQSVCEAGNSIEKLNVELYATKMELERLRSHSKDDHDMLTAENDELRKKIDDLKATIKLNEEALAHASLKYNMDLTALNTEITKLTAVLESEKMTREKLESEVESLRTRLETTSSELAKAQEARNELERKGFSQQEDLSRLLEKQEQDLTHLQETNQSLLQRLSEAENKTNKLETELHIANATLVERTNQLSTIQRELEQRCNNQRSLESELQKAKEENARLQAKLETLQERVASLQAEVINLRQQLDEAHVQAIGVGKEEGDRFTTVLSALREDHDKQRTVLEEKNLALSEQLNRVKDELHSATCQKSLLELQVRQLQDQLAEMSKEKGLLQASADLMSKAKEQCEIECNRLKIEIDKLQTMLNASNEKHAETRQRISELTAQLERVQINRMETSQQVMFGHSASKSKAGIEEYLRQLEEEKVSLEAKLKHEKHRVELLQEELDEFHKQSNGTRRFDNMAQLEHDKHEIISLLEEEKNKTQKAMELKKKVESSLSAEQRRCAELQKEVALLKTHLKAAKKRLKELENVIQSELEESNKKAQFEASIKKQLEGKTRQLEAELSAVRSMEKSYSKLDRAKRKLEEDLSLYRSHLDNGLTDPADLDRMKAEMEAKARLELNRKLEEVNIYLEEQARARDKLDRMRDINEAEMKKEFERSRSELLEDINRLRQSYAELLNQKEFGTDDAQRFKRLYETELQAREQLAKRLEKALKIQERAQTLIDRQNQSGSIYGPLLENGRAMGVKKPPMNQGMSDVLSAKLQQELDRSIAKHLEKGPHIDIMPPARTFDDSLASMSSTPYKSSSDYMSVLKKNYFL